MIICNLKFLLENKKIDQKELAKITGIRLPTINDYCNSKWKSMSKENMDKICAVLECKLSDLIEYKK